MEELLRRLRESGVHLWVEGDKLRFKGPPGAMTPELTEAVKASRDDIVAWLRSVQAAEAKAGPIPRVPREGPLPLHPAQERLIFLDRYEGGRSAAYNIPLALRLDGALDVAALEGAIALLVERHEPLRTSFALDGSGARQVVHESRDCRVPLVVHDVTEETLDETLARRAAELFDLEKAPLLRADLYRLPGGDRYVLLLGMHHIIADGWSKGVLLRDLSAAYGALRAGLAPALPALSVSYVDVAAWLRSRASESDLAYWKRKLDGLVDLDLPTDRVRPVVKTYAGAHLELPIQAEVAAGLRRVGRDGQATLFMVLSAACSLLLGRYSNHEDVVIGTPVAGRDRDEARDLVGFFVNSLALRVDLSGNPSFTDFLGRVRETCLEAYAHQDLPFEQVVAALKVQRDTSRTPVFQVMCVLQEAGEGGAASLPGLVVSEVALRSDAAKFDLSFTFADGDAGLSCQIEYNTDLFTDERIARMRGHLERLLEGIATRPATPVQEMPMLTPAEHDRIVHEWNRIDPPFVVDRTINQAFEEAAARFPDRIAVTCGDRSLTYRELDERANQVAHTIRDQYRKLRGADMKADELIGICVERDIEMVVGIMGILKSGGAYVPLDPRYPENRLRFTATDARCTIILTQQSCLEQLLFMSEGDFGVISLDGGRKVIDRASRERPTPINGPDNLAYVIYTSGSTGRPKGVLIPHSNVLRLFMACDRHYAFSERDVWSCFHSYAFDFSVWEIYGALLTGARLVVVPYFVSRDPEQFVSLVMREGVTVLSQTPSAFYHFAEVVLRSRATATPLRYVVYGGEALDIGRLAPWWERFDPHAPQLVNMYGITETTVHTTFLALSPADLDRKHVYSPIGTRLHDLTCYVLDPHRNPVPVAVPGEMYVGGAGVARGYFHRPELNLERFIVNPFEPATEVPAAGADGEPPVGPNPRLYKTGDVVRWMADGTLEYVGRNDFQVKIRGFRIELGEIESVLGRHPAIKECIVLARDIEGQQHLVTWYAVKRGAAKPSVQDLRAHLGKEVAEYMVPSFFVQVDELPLTEQGKIDRRALPMPEPESLAARSAYEAPRTNAERALVEIFEALFKTEGIGVHDSFFALGGNSLTSIHVVYKARDRGLNLSLRDVFSHPVIADLARCGEAAPTVAAEQGAVRGGAPLTPIQSWFFEQRMPVPQYFNTCTLVRCGIALEPSALSRALDAVVVQHDGLRARFRHDGEGGSWEAVLAEDEPAGHVPLEVLEVPAGDAASQGRFIEEACTRVEGALDFEQGPVARAVLFNGRGDGEQRLFLAFHYLVMDAVSVSIVLTDLETAYRQIAADEAVSLPPKTTSYKDWALAQVRWADGRGAREAWAFWSRLGADATPTHVDHAGALPERARTRETTLTFDAERTRVLLESLRGGEVPSLQDALLTALMRAWQEAFGARDLVLWLEGHGRDSGVDGVDVSRTVGWFTSLYPVHLRLPESHGAAAGDDWEEGSLRAVGEQTRAVPDRGSSYGVLRYHGGAERGEALASLDRSRVGFDYLGVLAEAEGGAFTHAGEPCGPRDAPSNRAHQWLDVLCAVEHGVLQCTFRYSTVHYEEASMARLTMAFQRGVESLAAWCPRARSQGSLPRFTAASRGRTGAYQPLMGFNTEGAQIPLFFVHPGQGGAEVYLQLSSLVDRDQPFYAVESYNLFGEPPLLQGIETIAARYLEHVRAVQPHGPYRLGGWCLGGLISYEMAHQLEREGEQVEVIYMIDTFAFGPREREVVGRLSDRPLLEAVLKVDPLYYQLPPSHRERVVDASIQEYADLSVYVQPPYGADVVLFKATRRMAMPEGVDSAAMEINQQLDESMIPNHDNGFAACASGLKVVLMEADHHSIMQGERLEAIARYIREDLEARRVGAGGAVPVGSAG